ncbi:MAG: methyl-accepting chemotaxis protein, partial [Bdellovibrionaceae bacterium]|nr:methyl-accepting chemotaxis protein [Pseudobdellovibrionaceae bacterium]
MSLVEVESNPKSAPMSFQKKLTFVFSLISFLGLLISTFIASYFSQNLVADSIIKSMHQRIVGLKSTIEVTYQDNLERQKQLIGNESLFEKRMVTNQVTGEKQEVTLHKMNWHGQGIENHNLVDQLSKDTGAAVTVLQYSEVGLVRISTSIRKNDGLRATNTFIPKDSEVVKKLEKGETFLGRAQVLGKWYMTAYQPILKEGRLLGAFFMGQYETSYEHIKTFLRSEKILKTGYLYVLDSRGVMQSHPTLEGKSAMDLTDADGFFLNKEVISKKSGQMKYRWEVDSQDKKGKEIVEKMAIFHYFPEMDWYVVASVPMEEVNEPVVSLRNTLYLVSSVMTLFMLITTLLFGRKVNQQMEVIGSEIEQASSVLTQRSSELAHSSDVLSDSAVKQASSLHETVSSLEQIKSMVEVNLDSTQKSEKLSANMKEEAGEGAKVLERLVSSIKNITRSNENMTSSLELNNKELLQIIDVIASINQK